MRRLILVALAVVAVTGCSSAHTRDIDTETKWFETSVELGEDHLHILPPDDVTVWYGLDSHPNMARVCLDGIAFVTSTSEFKAFERIPEWDDYCAAVNP